MSEWSRASVTELRHDLISSHVQRKSEVDAVRAFALLARKDLRTMSDKLRFSVAAISELEKIEIKKRMEGLEADLSLVTTQRDSYKAEILRLRKELEESRKEKPRTQPSQVARKVTRRKSYPHERVYLNK